MAIPGCCLVKLHLICLRFWYHAIRHASCPIENQKEKLLDASLPDMPTNNVKPRKACCQNIIYFRWYSATPCRELLCRCNGNKYACWPSTTTLNTAAVQTCLLVECCRKTNDYWTVTTQSVCLPIFSHSILHAGWCNASISDIHAGVMSCYEPCHSCWCGASL